ncbi:Grp1-Fun34-YaaH domain containing protein [Pyrenophora tritici-repentis]|uniref:Gpr fun34 family protein n=2 Tax=Pyrenophora tritici-repentis TaxID=45151 RepID=A0A922N4B1_9PLEO|nr:glyoxylate pathway regulator [Pyrenophora tritici-repentis Pt-1C-BFP]KAI1508747.1 gpr fun34 family protein [Pyrenophora tritici-repentis]EDU49980.1 glyoxylate pathway regulator [Pyrenophora tritici-repentis Pt-1C-BFP]KAI1667751.1 gpr fun34 family protein [Pyrenophora tritici-repentis]KAI1679964.1 gpr fun34 family protein [Pyrenophora tritici-repentis]PZD34000.1 Grp1-Fun34-YaaH domain containing protein [Pyrenophora tritici-repentis]
MATAREHNDAVRGPSFEKGTSTTDHAAGTNGAGMPKQRSPYDYGGNPLAHVATNDPELRLTAFGGEFQPGLYRPPNRKFANPAPLGLSAFALTTFVLSLINVKTRGLHSPNIVVALAYGYGGLVQLLAGMWEMAVGNTFGATALSSYGGFWIAFAIVLTPGGFEIETALAETGQFYNSFGLFLMGWFIFTFILLLCTLRSTVAFFFLFFTLDMAFLLLGIGYLQADAAGPQSDCIVAGGAFGLMAAFAAWYNALAGLADSSNSFFVIPVAHFPWSEKGRERRNKVDNSVARAESGHAA